MRILSLNAGSSTLKFGFFESEGDRLKPLSRGAVDRLGSDEPVLKTSDEEGKTAPVDCKTMADAVALVLKRNDSIEAIGCRVVHGGDQFIRPTLVDDAVTAAIQDLAPLAPLHNSRDLEVLQTVGKQLPEVPRVAVFDTSFHRTMPEVARQYALPRDLAKDKHVHRFGFHGISYQYISDRMAEALGSNGSRLILCHLGNGSSVCAVRNGESLDTSMGMTPLEGLVMGTRSGDLDPGAVLYLLRETGMKAPEIDDLLNHKSGLLGVSGTSADVRELEKQAKDGDEAAEFALDLFAYRVAKYVGAYSVVLDGFDALVFSGGIGENSHDMRIRICKRLSSLGIGAPNETSRPNSPLKLSGESKPSVWIVRTDEEYQIAIETLLQISA